MKPSNAIRMQVILVTSLVLANKSGTMVTTSGQNTGHWTFH